MLGPYIFAYHFPSIFPPIFKTFLITISWPHFVLNSYSISIGLIVGASVGADTDGAVSFEPKANIPHDVDVDVDVEIARAGAWGETPKLNAGASVCACARVYTNVSVSVGVSVIIESFNSNINGNSTNINTYTFTQITHTTCLHYR